MHISSSGKKSLLTSKLDVAFREGKKIYFSVSLAEGGEGFGAY